MTDLIHVHDKGCLHCDACGWTSLEPRALSPDLIGSPCPRCGASLLSERDYLATVELRRQLALFNKTVTSFVGATPSGVVKRTCTIRIHDGALTVTQSPETRR